jgi:hypothetical protein
MTSRRELRKSIDNTLKQIDENNVLLADRLKPSELVKQHLNPCGTDLILLSIKGHLIIERLLGMNLCRLLDIEDTPLGFAQKLRLLRKVVEEREPGPDADVFLAIEALNYLRNQLAHDLKNQDQIESVVKSFIEKCRKGGYVKSIPDGATSEQLKHGESPPLQVKKTEHVSALHRRTTCPNAMSTKRHKKDTKTFAELSFSEQAKSINATNLNMRKDVILHVRRAHQEGRDTAKTLRKCEKQFSKLLLWIRNFRDSHQ